jgi:outer membrane protein OmpA-like peptidoglycan-associated protein
MGLAVAALPFMLRGCAAGRDGAVARAPTNNQPVVRGPEIRDPNAPDPGLRISGYRPELKPIKVTLPNGTTLDIPEGSFLTGVHKFLADAGDDRSRSFVFENLKFDGPNYKTSPESENSLTIIGTLLKSFPQVQLRIDGHTDAHPDATESRRLSLARATAVQDLLVRAGVPAERITIEAFGHEKPIAPNDTEENRMKNRRVELLIVKR